MLVARNLDVTVNIRIIPHLKATAVRVHCRRQSIELDHGHVSSTAEPLAHSGRCWPNDAFADLELARKAKPHHVAVRLGHVEQSSGSFRRRRSYGPCGKCFTSISVSFGPGSSPRSIRW